MYIGEFENQSHIIDLGNYTRPSNSKTKRKTASLYQTEHFFLGLMRVPAGQLKIRPYSGRFIMNPLTLINGNK